MTWKNLSGMALTKSIKFFGVETYQWLRAKFPYEDFYEKFIWKDVSLYGSDRLGHFNADTSFKTKRFKGQVTGNNLTIDSVIYKDSLVLNALRYTRTIGKKNFELKDHLASVRTVVTDKKTAVLDSAGNCITGYNADILAAFDYYPFGMQMPGRVYDPSDSSIAGKDTCLSSDTVFAMLENFVATNGDTALRNENLLGNYFNTATKSINTVTKTFNMIEGGYYLKDTLDFNGSGYVDFGKRNRYKFGTGDFSVECWFYLPSGLASGAYTLVSNLYYSNTYYESGFELRLNTSNNSINFSMNDGAANWANSRGSARCFFTPGQWYHLVVTRTGNDVNNWTMYLNGVSQTVTVTDNTLTTGNISSGTEENLKIGTRLNGHPSNPAYLNGAVNHVRMYSRVLGSTEVAANYNDDCEKIPADTTGMVLWAKLTEGTGTEVYDYSSYNDTGTFTGTGLAWGRGIREKGCTVAAMCFAQMKEELVAGGYRYGFNGMEKDDAMKGSGNSYDFGARIYDPRIGRWLSRDPLANKFAGQSPYSYALNSPIIFIDEEGKEPARNQAGSINEAIQQWRDEGLTTIEDIRRFVDNKGPDGNAIRYIYTEDKGWIDLMHYAGTQMYGEGPMDLLEPASGSKILQDLFFSPTADKSYYSYEDLPSNDFSAEVDLSGLEGDELFNTILDHFAGAGATDPECAPNFEKIPFDDQDRERLPEIKSAEMIYSPYNKSDMPRIEYYSDEEKQKLLETGEYIPQNHSETPMELENFDAANTSLEKTQNE